MTAELLFTGAGSYTGERIRAELEEAGATLTVDTTWDATWIEASAPPDRLAVVLDIISLALTAPKFAPEDVASAKATFAGRATAELEDPIGTAERGVARVLFGKHTYGRAIDGDPASIESITPPDPKLFHQKFYGANTTVLSIAGPLDPAAALALVKPRFGRYLKRTVVPATFLPPDPAAATRVYVVDRPTPPGVEGLWPIMVDSVITVSVMVSIATSPMTGAASLMRTSSSSSRRPSPRAAWAGRRWTRSRASTPASRATPT